MEEQRRDGSLETKRHDTAARGPSRTRSDLEGEGGSLLPMPASPSETVGRELQLPTGGELELMLSRSEDGDSLADLEKAAATLVDVAKRQDLAKEQLFEIAEWHLRVRRKLGDILAQDDGRGGDRAKAQAAPLLNGGLPAGLDRSAARRCRQLARIADTDWDAYLVRTRIVSRMPSAEGALKFGKSNASSAVPKRKVRKKPKSPLGDIEVSPQVLDAIERCLGDIDLCVGSAKVKCRRRVTSAKLTADDLQGTVFVSSCLDPDVWLKIIVELKNSAQCQQAVVLLPARAGASWFGHLSCAAWHLCFVADPDELTVAAYLGTRSEAFFAAMHDHGLVVSVHE